MVSLYCNRAVVIVALLMVLNIRLSCCQYCSPINSTLDRNGVNGIPDDSFFQASLNKQFIYPSVTINCSAVLSEWEAVVYGAWGTSDVHLQVWRPAANHTYTLVSSTLVTVSASDIVSPSNFVKYLGTRRFNFVNVELNSYIGAVKMAVSDRPMVMSGDVIGSLLLPRGGSDVRLAMNVVNTEQAALTVSNVTSVTSSFPGPLGNSLEDNIHPYVAVRLEPLEQISAAAASYLSSSMSSSSSPSLPLPPSPSSLSPPSPLSQSSVISLSLPLSSLLSPSPSLSSPSLSPSPSLSQSLSPSPSPSPSLSPSLSPPPSPSASPSLSPSLSLSLSASPSLSSTTYLFSSNSIILSTPVVPGPPSETKVDSTISPSPSGVDHTISPSPSGVDHTISPSPSGVDHTISPSPFGVDHTISPSPSGVDNTISPSPSGVDNTISPSPSGVDNTISPMSGVDDTISPSSGVDNTTSSPSGAEIVPDTIIFIAVPISTMGIAVIILIVTCSVVITCLRRKKKNKNKKEIDSIHRNASKFASGDVSKGASVKSSHKSTISNRTNSLPQITVESIYSALSTLHTPNNYEDDDDEHIYDTPLPPADCTTHVNIEMTENPSYQSLLEDDVDIKRDSSYSYTQYI